MSLQVGLDFGTSNSGVAFFDGQRVQILPMDQDSLLPEVIKTILYITRDSTCYIGQEAVAQYYKQNINRTRQYVKKRVGEIEYRGADLYYVRDVYIYEDELKPGRLIQYLKTALRKGSDAQRYEGTQIFNQFYTVTDLVRVYLNRLKQRAEKILNRRISGVVLGRPVQFSRILSQDAKAEDTLRQAAFEAGFRKVEIALEPVAAARYFEQSLRSPQISLICDFGGGTLDLAVIRLGDASHREVIACGGIDIAGSDFDRTIIQKRLLPFFGLGRVKHRPDILEMIHSVPDWLSLPELGTPQNRHTLAKAIGSGMAPVQLSNLRALIYDDLAFPFYNKVENAKITLSNQGATVIALNDNNIDLWELYTRQQFESDIREQVEQIRVVLHQTLHAAGMTATDIDVVVKTGGSSNIPLFTEMLSEIFGTQKVTQSNPFSSVVAGLAIMAHAI